MRRWTWGFARGLNSDVSLGCRLYYRGNTVGEVCRGTDGRWIFYCSEFGHFPTRTPSLKSIMRLLREIDAEILTKEFAGVDR